MANRSKAISVEYLRPENGDFTFNWMELVPRPVLSIAGEQPELAEVVAIINVLMLFLLLQRTVSTSAPNWVHVLTQAFGVMTLYIVPPVTMRPSFSVRPL